MSGRTRGRKSVAGATVVVESETGVEERAFKNLNCSLKVLRFYVLVGLC